MPAFDAFRKAVITAYLDKERRHELPVELENPTPSKLKRYGLQVLAQRYSKADEPVLEMFFGPKKGDGHIEDTMRRFEIDKFKPLIRYLKGDTSTTDEKNVKILAWLIDFQPRPYERWREIGHCGESEPLPDVSPAEIDYAESTAVSGIEHRVERKTKEPNPWLKGGNVAGLVAAIAAVSCIVYLWIRPLDHQCMYWHEDRYITVDCQSQAAKKETIARDDHMVENFRKIMNPDTLTLKHVNKVWYSKIDNIVEFFTAPGFHPVHHQRSLKAATAHIIRQYAGKED